MTKIMFVDDEFEVLDGIRRNLRSKGGEWDLDFVTCAEQALDKISKDNVDVIVTDMRMPSMQGDHLVREVKSKFPNTVPIVLSGFSEPAVERQLLEDGVTFLKKPCDTETLVRAIHESLRGMDEQLRAATAVKTAPIFDGEIDIEEYLLLLTGSLVQNRLVDASTLPSAVRQRLRPRHRLPKIESRFLEFYEDLPEPANTLQLPPSSNGNDLFFLEKQEDLYRDTLDGRTRRIVDGDLSK